MSRGKAYTQEQREEIWNAYQAGFTIENICKYISSARGRSEKAIKALIDKMDRQLVEVDGEEECTEDSTGIVEELRRMNDLKLKELDLLQEIWTSARNIAVNTLNMSKSLNKKDESEDRLF